MTERNEHWVLVSTSDSDEPDTLIDEEQLNATSLGASSGDPNTVNEYVGQVLQEARSLLPKPAAFARLILSNPSTFLDAPERHRTRLEDTHPNVEGDLKDIKLRYRMSPIKVNDGLNSVQARLSWFDGEPEKGSPSKKNAYVLFRARTFEHYGTLSCTFDHQTQLYTEKVEFSLDTRLLGPEELSATVNHHRATTQTPRRTRSPSGCTNAQGKGSYDSAPPPFVDSQEHIQTGQSSANIHGSTPSSQNTPHISLRPGQVLGFIRRSGEPLQPTIYSAAESLCFEGDSDMSQSRFLCQRLLALS